MERISELWDAWWKVIGIFALIVGALAFVVSCQHGEKDTFLSCVDDAVSSNARDLYYANVHHDAVDSDLIHDFVAKCYDDRTLTGDADPRDYR